MIGKKIRFKFFAWHALEMMLEYIPQTSFLLKCVCRFGFVISLTYIEKHLDQEARFNILSMIRNIKYQFRENLYKLDWLDEATKNIVVEMLVTSVENIASSDNFIEKNNIYNQVSSENIKTVRDNSIKEAPF